jgi:hypothetical protein
VALNPSNIIPRYPLALATTYRDDEGFDICALKPGISLLLATKFKIISSAI